MDLHKAILELYEEKRRLDQLISSLEYQLQKSVPRSRRGRKSMSKEERAQVSERMRRYWQNKRDGGADEGGAVAEGPLKAKAAGEGE